MKCLATILILLNFPLLAQERNAEVRKLNQIVDYMDAFSRINQTAYFDVKFLAEAISRSCEKLAPAYFYSSRTIHSGTVYTSGIEEFYRFSELTPNASRYLPAYQSDWIPYLRERENARKIAEQFKNPELNSALSDYMKTADSLFYGQITLNAYVAEKQFAGDSAFLRGKQMLKSLSHWFTICHENGDRLKSTMRNYFDSSLKPNSFHPALLAAEKELRLTVSLLDDWERKLYQGDPSMNSGYDDQLRNLNEQGLSRDSLYLFQTIGYGNISSGWWPHSRFTTFYTSMKSNLYWYARETVRPAASQDPDDVRYNKFISGYCGVMEDYNDFIAIMDGKTFLRESACCLGPQEVDQRENVMLKFPRLLYRYTYIEPCTRIAPAEKPSVTESSDAERLANAVPHHLVYLLDVSGSMNAEGKLRTLKESAKYMVKLQGAKHRMSMVLFASTGRILLENVPCSDEEIIIPEIDALMANGTTEVKSGIETAASLAVSNLMENGKTKIVLVTDGIFKLDKQTKKRISAIRSQGVSFSVIYLGKTQDSRYEKQLRELCTSTGGIFHSAGTAGFREALVTEASE